MSSREPAWPEEDEWGPWNLISFKDPFETRKHESLNLFERRCRHCKEVLHGIPPRSCAREECQALNVISGYEPTSFKVVTTFGETVGYVQLDPDRTAPWLYDKTGTLIN